MDEREYTVIELLFLARKKIENKQDIKANKYTVGYIDEAIKWQRELNNK